VARKKIQRGKHCHWFFFIKGGYLCKDKLVAEEEFRAAVESLKEKEDNDVKRWAENIISTNFRVSIFAAPTFKGSGSNMFMQCLQTTETVAYWGSLAITSSSKEDVISADTMKFKITTASGYNKRSAPANTTASPPRKHITVG
jgi:hypothetical protein